MQTFQGDDVTVTDTPKSGEFTPHPEGTFLARCVDVVDLGEKVEAYQNNPKKLVPKLALVFATEENREFNGTIEPIPLVAEFSQSMGEKSNLRKFAESWRGKSYTDADIQQGVKFGGMAGAYAQISVEHKISKAGRTYANIKSISPVMKGVPKPAELGEGYQRPKFLTDRKAQYAAEAATFRVEIGAPPSNDFTAPPKSSASDDLPF